jgi:hypothetical protein
MHKLISQWNIRGEAKRWQCFNKQALQSLAQWAALAPTIETLLHGKLTSATNPTA